MPLNAALVTPAETPAACASEVMAATKLLKSPPQRAASAWPPPRKTMRAAASVSTCGKVLWEGALKAARDHAREQESRQSGRNDLPCHRRAHALFFHLRLSLPAPGDAEDQK